MDITKIEVSMWADAAQAAGLTVRTRCDTASYKRPPNRRDTLDAARDWGVGR